MKIQEPSAIHDIWDGVIEGKSVNRYEKTFGQVKSLYQNGDDVAQDTLVYTVYTHDETDPAQKGDLFWGLTVLEPVYPGGECNMTRGHFHADRTCAEYYFGLQGEGLLLLMDETGKTWAERVFRGSLHHIDGRLAHRLVNTGDVALKVGACWPTAAGHDYAAIESQEFAYRIFRRDGSVVFESRK